MIYLKSFILCGVISMIAQIILDNTKLTSGHITASFVIVGVILSFLGIYDYLSDFSLIGSSLPITSFGNSLYKAALEGFENSGFIGMFYNLLSTTSTGISSAVFFGFVFACLNKVRD